MRTKLRGVVALGSTLFFAAVLASACGSDDGGGGTAGSGGKDGGTGGSGGGTGGGGTGGSGTGGGGGCPAAPDPTSANACDVCQDESHLDCACDAEITACANDTDCSAIWDCVVGDSGTPACDSLDEAGAACVHACIAKTPAGKAKYLAMEKCGYCDYCGAACDTSEYCTALDNPPDGGNGDAGGDAASDAASDANGDGSSGDAATD